MPLDLLLNKWHRIVRYCVKHCMDTSKNKRSEQAESEQQPGNLSSFNKRDVERSTEAEGAEKGGKDESESYMDYNGNSEENAPTGARE